MTLCKCGCGQEVPNGKVWMKGHWAKSNSIKTNGKTQDRTIQPPPTPEPVLKNNPTTPIPDITTPADTHNQISDFQKAFENKIEQENKKESSKLPFKNIEPDPKFRPNLEAKESDKLRKFLEDMPIWMTYKPQGLRKVLFNIFNGKKTLMPCVFVADNRPPRIAYIPYEPEKNRLIIPGKGYYMIPISGEVAFFNYDRMLPLVNAPDIKNDFDLPAHVVDFAYTEGLAEGQSMGFKDLIASIMQAKIIMFILAGVAILALAALLYTTNNYSGISKELANVTVALRT